MRKILMVAVAVAFVGSVLSAPVLADECTGDEKVKIKCKAKKKGAELKIKVKRAVPDAELTIRFDDNEETDIVVETTSKGKARVKNKDSGLGEGDHTFTVLHGDAVCGAGDFSC